MLLRNTSCKSSYPEMNGSFSCLLNHTEDDEKRTNKNENFLMNVIRHPSKRRVQPQSSAIQLKRSISNSVERNVAEEINIYEACKNGLTEVVGLLLEDGIPDINGYNESGFSALHYAARYNHAHISQLLLAHGADPNLFNLYESHKFTPLQLACWFNAGDAAHALIRGGADVHKLAPFGHQAIHCAVGRADPRVLQMLLTEGKADACAADDGGTTALHIAASTGREDALTILLRHGADIATEDKEGYTAAQVASREGHVTALRHLLLAARLQGLPINHVLSGGDQTSSCLRLAVENFKLETARACIEFGADVSSTEHDLSSPLHVACIHGNQEMVKLLVSHNAAIDLEDADGMTPLLRACLSGDVDIIAYLIDQGASVMPDPESSPPTPSPLMCAVKRGHREAVNLLLSKNTPMYIRDTSGRCCLHVAVYCDDVETLKILLENGGKQMINIRDKNDKTPLHYAAIRANIQMISSLLDVGADVTIYDEEEKLPLHNAAEAGDLDCLKTLVEAAPDTIHVTDFSLRTPLVYTAIAGHSQLVEYLLSCGAKINSRDDDRLTPLLLSARESTPDVVQALLDHGADMNAMSKNRASPLDVASYFGNTSVVKLLMDRGACMDRISVFGVGCLGAAIRGRNKDVCMEIVKHARWKEALHICASDGHDPPMKGLIEHFPTVAKTVMDKCVSYSDHIQTDENYSVTYNFEFLDPGPRSKQSRKARLQRNLYFGPQCMLEHRQRELLFHPLAKELLKSRWNTLVLPMQWAMLIIYMLFVANLARFMTCFRHYDLTTGNYKSSGDEMCRPEIMTVQSLVAGCASGLWILVHCYRMVIEVTPSSPNAPASDDENLQLRILSHASANSR